VPVVQEILVVATKVLIVFFIQLHQMVVEVEELVTLMVNFQLLVVLQVVQVQDIQLLHKDLVQVVQVV
jgi:hypothetical protein